MLEPPGGCSPPHVSGPTYQPPTSELLADLCVPLEATRGVPAATERAMGSHTELISWKPGVLDTADLTPTRGPNSDLPAHVAGLHASLGICMGRWDAGARGGRRRGSLFSSTTEFLHLQPLQVLPTASGGWGPSYRLAQACWGHHAGHSHLSTRQGHPTPNSEQIVPSGGCQPSCSSAGIPGIQASSPPGG